MRPGRTLAFALAAIAAFLACTTPTLAKVKLDFDVGFENKFRPGKWTPLFITLQDSSPRQVVVEVYSPADRRYALNIRQGLTISPQPVTIPLYVPLSYRLDETHITVRDANSGRRLENVIVSDYPTFSRMGGPENVPGENLFVVISGSAGGERMIQSQLRHDKINTAYLSSNRLPVTPIGYESIDLLVLNHPDLARLNIEQQAALVAWVRAGGLLIIIPGTDPTPTTGPLIEILPARIGEVRQQQIDADAVKQWGLPARFAKQPGRELVNPAADARSTPLFDKNGPKALRRWVGLGQVMLVPLDVSGLAFDNEKTALDFWREMLKGFAVIPAVAADNNNNYRNYGYYGIDSDPRRAVALRQTLDWIGDVPGAGSFGFSYVAIVLLAMMFIVGPVDWFVLKWMGKQPWTWVTITGWIGVITLSSIYLGHVFKSGDVHYRTASVIDEAAGSRVASIDMAGIYSPRTGYYDLEVTPHGWWRTASSVNIYGGSDILTEVPCHQDYRGNRALPMLVNVWNMRFMEGQEIGDEPAMVQAHLSRAPGRKVAGSITNRAPFTMKDVLVRTRDGVAKLDGAIEPGATMQVSGTLVQDKALAATTQMTQEEQWQVYSRELPTTRPTPHSVNGLADVRAAQIDQQLADRDDVACVYASYDAPPTERLKLNGVETARTAHVGVVRAMVPLQP